MHSHTYREGDLVFDGVVELENGSNVLKLIVMELHQVIVNVVSLILRSSNCTATCNIIESTPTNKGVACGNIILLHATIYLETQSTEKTVMHGHILYQHAQ